MSTYDGSTPHPDASRETFCQELIAGEALYAAYETAGFKRPRGNAQRMQQEPDVAARLKWLGERLAPFDEAMLAYRRQEHRRALEHIATADRLALFEERTITVNLGKGADGKPRRKRFKRICLKPLAKLTDEERALVNGFEITDKGGIKVLMPKRLDARQMLAKLDGIEKPTKVAATDPSGEHPAHYIISEKPMSEAEWEASRAGAE